MAWEEENIESGADFSVGGGKKNKLKMIIIAVVALAALGALGWFLKGMFLDKPAEKPAAAAADPAAAPAEGEAPADAEAPAEEVDPNAPPVPTAFRVNLDKFTINLSGAGTAHYLVTTIVLEVSTPELKAAFDDPEDKDFAQIRTRDLINSHLMTKTYEEIRDPGSSTEISKELKFKLNRILTKGTVNNVYFSEFLVD